MRAASGAGTLRDVSAPLIKKEEQMPDATEGPRKRRGRGEGSIHLRSDGRYAATVSLGYRGRKRIRKTFYGKTRKQVRDQLTNAGTE